MFGFLGLEVVEDLVDDHRVLDAGNHLHRPLALFAFGNVDVEDALQASGPGHGGPLLQRCAFLGRKVHGTDLACPLATFGRGDRYTVVAVGGEHAVEAGQVHSRFGHQRRQLRHEVQGLEDHMGGAVPVRCLEFVTYPAVSCQRQTLLRDRRARHIIRTMVEMMEPNPARGETICDPACGTGGFLATSYEYLLEKYSSLESIHTEIGTNERGELEEQKIFTGDLLTPWRNHVDNNMFHGYDFDTTMLRIAAMNLIMHGVEAPDIHYQDTMSQSFSTNFPQASKNAFNLILANPPFTGSLDEEDIDSTLSAMVKTKKTELLFLARILQMLKVGGRSATIVPQGVLFGSSKAHQSLRKTLVEDNQLEAVINLPSGVFKPYAGVATAILIFTKGGQTDEVWFYDLQNDGYSLDDKRNPIKDNDLPHLLASWKHYRTLRGLPVDNFMGEKLASLLKQQYPEGIDAGVDFKDRTQAAFIVPKEDIAAQKYDLSINRYKEVVYQAEEYEDPKVILKRLKDLEKEILADLDELEGML